MILSLRNLTTIEVIGEYSANNQDPPQAKTLRRISAKIVRSIRLRGYIPALFISEMCKASASSITSLDLGVLETPKVYVGNADEQERQGDLGYPLYVAPRGVIWFSPNAAVVLSSVSHLLLYKRRSFDAPPGMSEEEGFEVREDNVYEVAELKHWASLLRSVRSTVVEVVLDQRPKYLSYLLDFGLENSPHNKTSFCPELNSFDSLFYQHILKSVFDDGGTWPKLKKPILRGVTLLGFEEEAGEALQIFMERVLPGVQLEQVAGNYMFFSTRKGTIMNEGGADGLKSDLDPNSGPSVDGWELDNSYGLFL
jgi:hypothetical protein